MKGDHVRRETKVCSLYFRLEDLRENRLHDELMLCLLVFQHDQCPPQGKEKLLLEDPLSQRGNWEMKNSTFSTVEDFAQFEYLRTRWPSGRCVAQRPDSHTFLCKS